MVPTRVLDPRDGELLSECPAGGLAAGLDGGSNGVEVSSGWLFVAGVSKAEHRFVLIDRNHAVVAVSPVFSIAGGSEERCLGLAARAGQLILAFGFENRSAGLAVAPLNLALGLFEPC